MTSPSVSTTVVACLVVAASLQAQKTTPVGTSRGFRAAKPTGASTKFRMRDGHPNLEGRWNFSTVTPFERPAGLPLLLNETQAAELEKRMRAQQEVDEPRVAGDVGFYNKYWTEAGAKLARINGVARGSLIVDPPDGRIPPMTETGRAIWAAVREKQAHAERAEDRAPMERCVIGYHTGPPLTPGQNGNLVEIVQNKDYVAVMTEQIHLARIFPVDGRPHSGIRQWNGDYVARWEGDTLVVDSTNYINTAGITDPRIHGQGIGKHGHLVERFSRLDEDTLLYSFTIEDPDLWTKPWTMEFPFVRTEEPILEYACYEDDRALPNILSAIRATEKRAREAQAKEK